MSERIAVAMSGGVDSSVAAALLREQGYSVVGLTLRLRDCAEAQATRSCCGVDGVVRARDTAGQLGIAHYVVDCVHEFGERVLRPAWEEYSRGRTPSPCLLCNERIKFGLLLERVRELGLPALATGHYAQIATDSATGRPALRRASDADKDQSYFLAGLTVEQLALVRFPIGALSKQQVRERARALGLPSADTPDSQDACLVGPDQSFAESLRERFHGASQPGPIVDGAGTVLGAHQGLHHFTVGQRRGLSGLRSTRRHWVRALRAADAAVVVTDDERELLGDRLIARGVSWLAEWGAEPCRRCEVQVRYRHAAAPALVERIEPDSASALFDSPVRAITPGQAAVFYDRDRVLGRGWIDAI
jgi:tRNA-uridine 2-sulfurtransferase